MRSTGLCLCCGVSETHRNVVRTLQNAVLSAGILNSSLRSDQSEGGGAGASALSLSLMPSDKKWWWPGHVVSIDSSTPCQTKATCLFSCLFSFASLASRFFSAAVAVAA